LECYGADRLFSKHWRHHLFISLIFQVFKYIIYFRLGGDWKPGKLSRYLINKNFDKLCVQTGYDVLELAEVSKSLDEIRGRIKTNIVTNL
jgi:hypothetical protein